MQTLGDAPIEEQYRVRMEELARMLDKYFNGEVKGPARKTGFILLVFPFNDHEGRCNYISNGGRPQRRGHDVPRADRPLRRFAGPNRQSLDV
jgi:hypothetical protein